MVNPGNGIINWLTTRRNGTSTPSLGARELAILDILWGSEAQQSAQDVLDRLHLGKITLSTVQSTLERLHRKQLLAREKQARAYYYSPLVTRHEIIRSLLHDITAEIAGGDIAPVVSGFMDYLGGEDPDMKSVLSKMLDEPGTADDNE